MRGHQLIARTIAVLGLAILSATAAERWTCFSSRPESMVELAGSGSLHDWKIQGSVIEGVFMAGPDFPYQSDNKPIKPGKVAVRVEASVPVHSLTNGSKIEARWARSVLKQEKHPHINYHLDEFFIKSAPLAGQSFYEAETRGTLTVAGVTNMVSLPVRIELLAGQQMKISGNGIVKLSDFKIESPVLRGAKDSSGDTIPDIKASRDEITLTFDWFLGPAKPSEK